MSCQYFIASNWYTGYEVRHMKPLKDRISITIDSDILAKLRDKAEYDGRSLSQYINLVLKRHLEKEENERNRNAPL